MKIRRLLTFKLRKFRLPIIFLVTTVCTFILYFEYFCPNYHAWWEATNMCKIYKNRDTIGSLCPKVCEKINSKDFQCDRKYPFFLVNLQDAILVFKRATDDLKPIHWSENGIVKYPSEVAFSVAIQSLVKVRLNLTVPPDVLLQLTKLSRKFEDDVRRRHKEMDTIWTLLQNDEYLLSKIFADRDVFPQILGTCGFYFATEFLEPLESVSALLSLSDDRDSWGRRLRSSIQILELLEDLETDFQQKFYLCDVKMLHFGLTKNGKLKFTNFQGLYPIFFIDKMFAEIQCDKDEDCRVYDCVSKCDRDKRRCGNYQGRNNLQIVCEKIFLGWRLSRTFIVPGLLMSQHTPGGLAALLRQCAILENANEDLKERLFNILTEVEANF